MNKKYILVFFIHSRHVEYLFNVENENVNDRITTAVNF